MCMKIYTEQYLNYRLAPLSINKRVKQKYPYRVCETIYYQGFFDAECWMMLDVITTMLIQSIWNNKDGKVDIDGFIDYNRTRADIVERMSVLGKITKNFNIENHVKGYNKVEEFQLFEMKFSRTKEVFPFLKFERARDMSRVLKKLNKCMFGINYYTRYLKSKNPVEYGINYFDFKQHPMKLFDIYINEKPYDTSYKIFINNYFGYYFYQNVVGLFVHQLDSKLYECSNYAQLLYRYILTSFKHIEIDRVKSKLNFEGKKNQVDVDKQLEKYLHELASNKLIEDFDIKNSTIDVKFDQGKVGPNLKKVGPNLKKVGLNLF